MHSDVLVCIRHQAYILFISLYFIYKLPVFLSRISYEPFFSVSVVVVLQSLSCVQYFATPWTAASQASLSFTFSWNLLKLMSIELGMLSSLSSSAALFSFCFQSFPASGSLTVSRLFVSDSQSIGASASASVFPMNIQS